MGLSVQAAVVLRRWVPVPLLTGSAVLSALMLFGELGKAQLYVGQINPLIAVGAAGSLIARRTHPGWASVALGVAWIKPQFGLPLALLLAVRGSPRVALAGTGVAAVASLPVAALLVVREGGVGGFLDSVGANLAHAQTTSYGAFDSPTTFRIDLVAALFRVTGWAPPAAELVAFVLVLGTSALALRALARCERADPTNAAAAGVLADLLIGLAVVTAVVHQPGDLLITFPATIAAAGMWWWIGSRTGSGGEAARVGVSRPLLAVAIGLIAVPYLHVYQVGNVLAAVFGLRVAGAVDGVAASAAWVVVLVLAARLPSRARQIADAVTTTASGTRNHR